MLGSLLPNRRKQNQVFRKGRNLAKEPKEAASGLKPGLVQLSVSSLSGIRTPLPALSYQDAAGSRWLMPDLPASSGGRAGSGFGRQTVQKLRDRGSGRPLSSLSPAAPAQQRGHSLKVHPKSRDYGAFQLRGDSFSNSHRVVGRARRILIASSFWAQFPHL